MKGASAGEFQGYKCSQKRVEISNMVYNSLIESFIKNHYICLIKKQLYAGSSALPTLFH